MFRNLCFHPFPTQTIESLYSFFVVCLSLIHKGNKIVTSQSVINLRVRHRWPL